MASELVRQLVDSGIHFGHRVSRWNPKMSPYIYGKRNLIHIIDIRETVKGLLRAKNFVSRTVASGKDVLFVGTKRQAKAAVVECATRVEMPYVTERWLGGTLTNFRTIRSRLGRLDELETEASDGTISEYSKKAIASRTRELRKIKRNLEGIRLMDKLPGCLVIIDVRREHIAVREARKLHIPTVCLIDTDSDPDFADIPIPGNDDAMRSIELILRHLSEAVEAGKRGRRSPEPTDEAETPAPRRSERSTTALAEPQAEESDSEDKPPGEGAPSPSAGEGEKVPGGVVADSSMVPETTP